LVHHRKKYRNFGGSPKIEVSILKIALYKMPPPPLWPSCTQKRRTTFGFTYWELVGTPWELDGNTLGTAPQKNPPSPPSLPPKKKYNTPLMTKNRTNCKSFDKVNIVFCPKLHGVE